MAINLGLVALALAGVFIWKQSMGKAGQGIFSGISGDSGGDFGFGSLADFTPIAPVQSADEDLGIAPAPIVATLGYPPVNVRADLILPPASVPVLNQKPIPVSILSTSPGTFSLAGPDAQFDHGGDVPLFANTPITISQQLSPITGLLGPTGFGPTGGDPFSTTPEVLIAAIQGFDNIFDYRASLR